MQMSDIPHIQEKYKKDVLFPCMRMSLEAMVNCLQLVLLHLHRYDLAEEYRIRHRRFFRVMHQMEKRIFILSARLFNALSP